MVSMAIRLQHFGWLVLLLGVASIMSLIAASKRVVVPAQHVAAPAQHVPTPVSDVLDSHRLQHPMEANAECGASAVTARAAAAANGLPLSELVTDAGLRYRFVTKREPHGYLAVCSVQRNSHDDIREWVEWHLWAGVEMIYIFDDNSNPPMAPLLADLIVAGQVMVATMPSDKSVYFGTSRVRRPGFRRVPLGYGYDHCLQRHVKRRHRWIAFLDGDEFLVQRPAVSDALAIESLTATQPDMIGTLRGLEKFAGLEVNWVVFGTNGHVVRPAGSLMRSHTACAGPEQLKSRGVKTIVNTAWALDFNRNNHKARYKRGAPHIGKTDGSKAIRRSDPVCEGGEECSWHSYRVTHFPLVIFHYVAKSKAQIEAKIQLGFGHGSGTGPGKRKDVSGTQHDDAICVACIRCDVSADEKQKYLSL